MAAKELGNPWEDVKGYLTPVPATANVEVIDRYGKLQSGKASEFNWNWRGKQNGPVKYRRV